MLPRRSTTTVFAKSNNGNRLSVRLIKNGEKWSYDENVRELLTEKSRKAVDRLCNFDQLHAVIYDGEQAYVIGTDGVLLSAETGERCIMPGCIPDNRVIGIRSMPGADAVQLRDGDFYHIVQGEWRQV